ncbi:MAG: hypothetical protein GY711_16835 [bacterium]|nr:hypothetical protein [bacterium]
MNAWAERRPQAVVELLREMSEDPRSTLLRVSPLAIRARGIERVSDQVAGLTVAERQLVRVHRAETALFLRDLARETMTKGEKRRMVLTRSHEVPRDRRAANPAEAWPERADLLAGMPRERMLAVDRALRGSALEDDAAALVALASRLEDSPPNRQLRAATLVDAGDFDEARRLYLELMHRSPSPVRRAQACASLGFIATLEENYVVAFERNRRALGFWPGQPMFVANMLAAAFRARSAERVQEAARALAGIECQEHHWRRVSALPRRGAKVFVRNADESWFRVVEDLDPAIRSIRDAVCTIA